MTEQEAVLEQVARQYAEHAGLSIHPETVEFVFEVLAQVGANTSAVLEGLLISGAMPGDVAIRTTVDIA